VTDAGTTIASAANLWQCTRQTGRCSAQCDVVDWSCAGKVVIPPPSRKPLDFYLQILNLSLQPSFSGLDVRECARGDTLVDTPCQAPRERGSTRSNGIARLPIDLGYGDKPDVYFDVQDTQTPPRIAETIVFPLLLTHSESLPALTVPPAVITNPALGAIFVFVTNCIFGGGATVAVTPAGSSKVGYVRNNQVDPNATCTDGSSLAFITDVPPGWDTVEVTRCDTHEHVGSARVLVRAGALTQVSTGPFDD
jgi:hypothetical protein